MDFIIPVAIIGIELETVEILELVTEEIKLW